MNLISDQTAEWIPQDLLTQISDINVTFVRLLTERMSMRGEAPDGSLAGIRELLYHSDAAARAARAPLLLLDFEFHNEDWWTAIARDPTGNCATRQPYFPREEAVELARTTLVLAWHLARADLATCLVLMGLSAPVARIVGSLRPKQLDQIAERHYTSLAPRWVDSPSVWRELLSGPDMDQNSMRAFAIRALELSWSSPRPSM